MNADSNPGTVRSLFQSLRWAQEAERSRATTARSSQSESFYELVTSRFTGSSASYYERRAHTDERRDASEAAYFTNKLRRAVGWLCIVYWLADFLACSILWWLSGMDLTPLVPKKFILNSSAAFITFGMTFILMRFRHIPIFHKIILCLLISMLASPIYLSVELLMDVVLKYPHHLEIDFSSAGNTLTYGSSAFFGWLCLYVALLYNFEVRDRERSLAVVREEALSAQMRALRYQVNPHFLFNTLNSIAGLIEEGSATRAERMVLSLSTFLRTTLSLDPIHDVSLADELALQEEYLEIERERFSDRMAFSIDMPEDVRNALVPSLILQPLIENAIKHGVGATVGNVEIALRASRQADRLCITIENDMPKEDDGKKPAGMGVGLKNVADRLRARFQEDGQFSSGPIAPGRYRASIDLPWRLA